MSNPNDSDTKQSPSILRWMMGSVTASICAAFAITVFGLVLDPLGSKLVHIPIAGRFFKNLCYEVHAQCGLPEETHPAVQAAAVLPAPPSKATNNSLVVAQQATPRQAETLFQEGNTRLADGDKEGAIESWNKALDLDPKSSETYFALGKLRLQHNLNWTSFQKVENDFNDALKYASPKGKMALQIADLYYENSSVAESKAKVVISLYTTALREMPNCSSCFLRRGVFKYRFGDTDEKREAFTDLDRAVHADPKSAEAYLQRAELNLRQSNNQYDNQHILTRSKPEILSDYEKALELFANTGKAEKLQEIKGDIAYLKDEMYR
jgi:tetratricopeptide (TPR) repeat protein